MTDAQALSTFLTVASFLLAVLGAVAALSAPGRARLANLDVKPVILGYMVAGLNGIAAVGAVGAWVGMYSGNALLPFREASIAGLLLLTIVAQPLLATLIARGLRDER